MNTSYQKRLAAKVMGCSPRRVKVSQSEEVGEALTRNDVKRLVVKGLITKRQKKGTSRVKANYIAAQKKKGRRHGRGKKGGKRYSRVSRKDDWMKTVRALRRLLRDLKDNGQIAPSAYGSLYKRVKGREFRNRNHMLSYLRENGMLKGKKKGGTNA